VILNLAVAAGGLATPKLSEGRSPAIQQLTRQVLRTKQVVLLITAFLGSLAIKSQAAEVIPPKPERYFNDYAGVVSIEAARRFNEQLAQFERETSDQVVVAVWQTMPSQSSIEDFTQRTFQAWTVGQKGLNNGVVLFVFVKDRRMRIQPGYGLEGALPDILCDQIIRNEIAPHFRSDDYEGGLAAGIDAVCKAIRGEYKGTGRAATETRGNAGPPSFLFFIIFVIALIVISRIVRRLGGYGYSSRGGGPIFIPMGRGGGGWSSGGGGGGGFSGFSGGGGLSGGGGASGSW
jgi:uncharacterized protein